MGNNHERKVVTIVVVILFSTPIVILAMDYCNILSAIGIKVANINMDILSNIIGMVTTFSVFFLTYYCIERWNVERTRNQREVACILVQDVIQKCRTYSSTLEGDALDIIRKRTDPDKLYYGDGPMDRYAAIPFKNEDMIIQFAAQGVLSSDLVQKYYTLKENFSTFVSMRVIFPRTHELVISSTNELTKAIDNASKALEREI